MIYTVFRPTLTAYTDGRKKLAVERLPDSCVCTIEPPDCVLDPLDILTTKKYKEPVFMGWRGTDDALNWVEEK